MNAYIFQGALLCEECGEKMKDLIDVTDFTDDASDEYTFDSDDYPKGPYQDGGGEADTPHHCDDCDIFLENPLTEDGKLYVREQLVKHAASGHGDDETIKTWSEFYDIDN